MLLFFAARRKKSPKQAVAIARFSIVAQSSVMCLKKGVKAHHLCLTAAIHAAMVWCTVLHTNRVSIFGSPETENEYTLIDKGVEDFKKLR